MGYWIKVGKRLVNYGTSEGNNPQTWTDHFKEDAMTDIIKSGYSNTPILNAFRKYIPKDGKIIEGGAGVGRWLVILKELGYDIEGIDFSKELVQRVKDEFPDIPYKVGNIFNLDYPNDYFDAYISMGVVEHFQKGPEKALREAYRVLKRGSILFCAVPYFNPVRQFKSYFGSYREGDDNKWVFFEYAFSKREFKEILRANGFRTIQVVPYKAFKGITTEVPGVIWLYNLAVKFGRRLFAKKVLNSSSETSKKQGRENKKPTLIFRYVNKIFRGIMFFPPLLGIFGDEVMFVCVKE